MLLRYKYVGLNYLFYYFLSIKFGFRYANDCTKSVKMLEKKLIGTTFPVGYNFVSQTLI